MALISKKHSIKMKMAFHLPKIEEKNDISNQLDTIWRILMPGNYEARYDHFRISSATMRAGKMSPSWPLNRKSFRPGGGEGGVLALGNPGILSEAREQRWMKVPRLVHCPWRTPGKLSCVDIMRIWLERGVLWVALKEICRLNPAAAVEIRTSPRLKARVSCLRCMLCFPKIHEVVPWACKFTVWRGCRNLCLLTFSIRIKSLFCRGYE